TVLGTGVQTARAVLDAGDIGQPIAATAFMTTPGHERWHPAPEFYYQPGGGPLLDMGPYYLTALVTLLGPVRRVVGMSATPRASSESWSAVPEAGGYPNAARGYGLSDLARAISTGGRARASGDLAFHVLDVMESLLAAAEGGTSVDVASTVDRPAPVPLGARPE